MQVEKISGIGIFTQAIKLNVEWVIQIQQTAMTKETTESVFVVLSALKRMADEYDTNVPMGNATEEAKLNAIMKIIPDLYFNFIVKYLLKQ